MDEAEQLIQDAVMIENTIRRMQMLQRNFTIGNYFNLYRRVSWMEYPIGCTAHTILQQ
jgi:hypothetical protein